MKDGYGEIDGDLVLVVPGWYELRFDTWHTVNYLARQPKVVLRFRICSQGPFFGVPLSRWYNVKSLKGGPRKRGGFRVGRSCDLLRDFASLFVDQERFDRVALSKLKPLLVRGEAVTVVQDRRQQVLSPGVRYSTLRTLKAGGP